MDADMVGGAVEPEVKQANEFGTLGTIFFNPRATFAAMAAKPRFLLAMILVVVASSCMAVPSKICGRICAHGAQVRPQILAWS